MATPWGRISSLWDRLTMVRAVGAAFLKFLDRLSAGDPVALGLLGFLIFLFGVAGAIWYVDRKNQRRGKAKGNGRGR